MKDTTAVVIDEEIVVLFVEEKRCEHVANNDDDWVVDYPLYCSYKRVIHHVQSRKFWYCEDGQYQLLKDCGNW
jgi:hypothetical protein